MVGRAAGEIDGVVHRGRALVVRFLHPVGTLPGTVLDGLVQAGRQDARPVGQGDTLVLEHQVQSVHVLLRIQEVGHLGDVLLTVVSVVGKDRTAFLTLLGGHEDNAVRSTRTVDGGGGGVLEDVDGLDVGGVQGAQAAARDAVDDVQRLGIADGAHTADVHLEALARLTGTLGDGDARALALESAEGRGGVEFREVVALHLDRGPGEELLLLDTVTDDHRLGQLVQVGFQDDVHDGTAVDGDFLAGVAEDFHGEDAVGRSLHRVLAVDVGRGPVGRSLDDDRGERDGFAVLAVSDGSRDGLVLRAGSQREKPDRKGQKEFGEFHR